MPAAYTGQQAYPINTANSIMQQMIGVKSEYYISQFDQIKMQNSQISWNWAAFLVPPFWLIYRKMYAYGTTFLFINYLFSLIMPGIAPFISLIGSVMIGIYANAIYMNVLNKKETQAAAMDAPRKSWFVAQHGGVSSQAVFIAIAAHIVLLLIQM